MSTKRPGVSAIGCIFSDCAAFCAKESRDRVPMMRRSAMRSGAYTLCRRESERHIGRIRLISPRFLSFDHGINPVKRGKRYLFLYTARPVDLHLIHFRRRAEAEVQPLVGTRLETAPTDDVAPLPEAAGSHKYLCSNGIAR